MNLDAEQAKQFELNFNKIVDNVERAVLGKRRVIKLALTCMLSEGHLLLEDYPGTGKTMLAKALARSVQGSNSRIQFTPDLLPSDVTGVTIYDQRTGQFTFHHGPVFASVVLADEINRASPKTQAALLEVMEEGKVTVDGTRYDVDQPFMVIATQNPIEQAGTYRLPEAQLDRFLMKAEVGYPDHESTIAVLQQAAIRDRSLEVQPIVTAAVIADMARRADTVHVDPSILAYISRIAEESRSARHVRLGMSVRGCLAFVRCAKTWAAADGRHYVVPDDVKDLAQPILAHRLLLDAEAEFSGVTESDVVETILAGVQAPAERAA